MKKQIIGNWKLNGSSEVLKSYASSLLKQVEPSDEAEIGVAVPFPYIGLAAQCLFDKTIVKVGAQNCCAQESGAFTGEVSTDMIRDVAGAFVIVGHSERRSLYGETSMTVSEKASSVIASGMVPIICVGESEEEREQGIHLDVIKAQLKESVPADVDQEKMMIAYEPVWAIGTGKVASLDDIKEMHNFIKEDLGFKGCALLYGGSVKPDNAKDILSVPSVTGVLVGGASLKADDFAAIYNAV